MFYFDSENIYLYDITILAETRQTVRNELEYYLDIPSRGEDRKIFFLESSKFLPPSIFPETLKIDKFFYENESLIAIYDPKFSR